VCNRNLSYLSHDTVFSVLYHIVPIHMYLRQKENVHNYLFMYAHTRVYLEGDGI